MRMIYRKRENGKTINWILHQCSSENEKTGKRENDNQYATPMIYRKRENGKTGKQQLGYHIDDTQTTVNCENDNLDVVTVRKTENVARDNGHYFSICIYI